MDIAFWKSRPRTPSFTAALHVFTLCSLAVAQPLYNLVGKTPEFLVVHQTRPLDLLVLVGLLTVMLPLDLVLLRCILGMLHAGVGRAVDVALVAVLCGIVALPMLKQIAPGMTGASMVAIADVLALLAGFAWLRLPPFRTFLTLLSPVCLIFPMLFLFATGALKVLAAQDLPLVRFRHVKASPPIVMVVFDELPLWSLLDEKDQVDAVLFPSFAAIQATSTWYRNATTVSNVTTIAVPAILTGRYPHPGQTLLPTASEQPENLFSLLDGRYDLHVHEAVTALYPQALATGPATFGGRLAALLSDVTFVYLKFLLPNDLSQRIPDVSTHWANFDERMMDAKKKDAEAPGEDVRFLKFIESIRPSERPTLYFLHVVMPHGGWKGGWQFLPNGRHYAPGPLSTVNWQWGPDRWEVIQGMKRHLLQLGFVDNLLGRLVAQLKAQQMFDRAMIVLVADHGIVFAVNRERREVTAERRRAIMCVPLFVKYPEQRAARLSDRNVEVVDVVPTIADTVGVRLPWKVDGASLRDERSGERPRKSLLPMGGDALRFSAEWEPMPLALRDKLDAFGSHRPWQTLLDVVPRPELLGRSVAGMVAGDSSLRATMNQASRLEVGGGDFVPALISGQLHAEGPLAAMPDVAVAINGVIRAVNRPEAVEAGKATFDILVPEGAFRMGSNEVRVYVAAGRGPRTRLLRIQE